jgi:hypothetical protein
MQLADAINTTTLDNRAIAHIARAAQLGATKDINKQHITRTNLIVGDRRCFSNGLFDANQL